MTDTRTEVAEEVQKILTCFLGDNGSLHKGS